MCIFIKTLQILTAEKPIPCYKRVHLCSDDLAESRVHDFMYKRGERSADVDFERDLKPTTYTGNLFSGQGYYSYIERNKHNITNALFIIPKGAKYLTGWDNRDYIAPSVTEYDTYLSSSIIFVGADTRWNRFWYGLKYGVKF